MVRLKKSGLTLGMTMYLNIVKHANYKDIMTMDVLSYTQSYIQKMKMRLITRLITRLKTKKR